MWSEVLACHKYEWIVGQIQLRVVPVFPSSGSTCKAQYPSRCVTVHRDATSDLVCLSWSFVFALRSTVLNAFQIWTSYKHRIYSDYRRKQKLIWNADEDFQTPIRFELPMVVMMRMIMVMMMTMTMMVMTAMVMLRLPPHPLGDEPSSQMSRQQEDRRLHQDTSGSICAAIYCNMRWLRCNFQYPISNNYALSNNQCAISNIQYV